MATKQSKTELVITAIDKASAILNRISDRMEKVTKPVENLQKAFKRLYETSGAERVMTAVGGVSTAIGDLMKRVALLSGAFAGAAAALVRFGLSGVDAAVKIADLSEKYQVQAETLQLYGKLAQEAGGSTESAAASIGKLKKAMQQAMHGGKEQAAAFKGIGISVQELKNLKPEQVMAKLANAFKGSQKDLAKQAVLQTLMGESGEAMMAVFNRGADAIEEFKKQLQADGQLISDEDLKRAQKFDTVWKRLTGTFEGLKTTLGIDVAEVLGPSVERLQKYLVENSEKIRKGFGEFLEKLPEFIDGAIDFFKGLWSAVSTLINVFRGLYKVLGPTMTAFLAITALLAPMILAVGKLAFALGTFGMQVIPGVITALKGLWAIMMANPMMIIMASVAALAAVIYANWDSITAYVSKAWDRIKAVFDVNFFSGIIQVWLEAWQGLANGIMGIIKSILPDAILPDAIKNFKFSFADNVADKVAGRSPAGSSGPAAVSAADVARSKTEVGGTLKIQIEGADTKVTELRPAGKAMNIDVSTGPTMIGA